MKMYTSICDNYDMELPFSHVKSEIPYHVGWAGVSRSEGLSLEHHHILALTGHRQIHYSNNEKPV